MCLSMHAKLTSKIEQNHRCLVYCHNKVFKFLFCPELVSPSSNMFILYFPSLPSSYWSCHPSSAQTSQDSDQVGPPTGAWWAEMRSVPHAFTVGGWQVFISAENRERVSWVLHGQTHKWDHREQLGVIHCTNWSAWVLCSGISLQRWEAEQMNRKGIPVQPFNYGKVGKGKETKWMCVSSLEKEAALELLPVGL